MLATAIAAKTEVGGVQDHEMREKTDSRIMVLDFQSAHFGLLRDLLGMGYSPGEKRGPGEPVDLQGSPSPSSGTVHTNTGEIK